MKKMTTAQKCALVTSVVALLTSQGLADAKLDELMSAKKYDEAISYVNSTLTPPTKRTVSEWMHLADAHLKTDNKNKALATYIIASRMNPQNGEPLAGAAAIYFDQGDFDKAESFGKKAFGLTPNAESAWQYARAAIKLNKPAEAKKALETVISTDPGNVQANSSLGIIYYDEKAYDKAASLLEIAYQNGASQDLAYKVALSYNKSGNMPKAKEFYALAVADGSKLYKAMVEFAEIHFKDKAYGNAYTQFINGKKGQKLTAEQQYKLAVSAKNEKKSDVVAQYAEAVKLFGTATSAEALAARLFVADKAYEAKSAADAEKHYAFYLTTKGSDAKASPIWFKRAEMQIALKQNDAAVVSLNKSIELDKGNVGSYALLADLYAQLGDDVKSEATLEGLIKQNQSDPSVYLKLGTYKLSKKQYDQALINFEKSSTLKASTEASEGIALSAAALKQWDKVVPAGKASLAANDNLDVRKVYAQALVEKAMNAEAKPEIANVLKAEPKNITFWKMQLKVSTALADKPLSLQADSALVKLEPKNIESRKRYSEWLISQKKVKEAYPVVVELSMLEPKVAGHFKTAADLAEELKKSKEAIAHLQKFVVLMPKDVEQIVRLGELFYATEQFDSALNQYRNALAINKQPEGFPYEHYADLVIKKGQTEEVITALSGLVETGKADAGTYTTLGMLYKNKKMFAKAIPMYEKALALKPEDLASNLALGECQLNSGDNTMAIVSFEQAVMMNPDSAIAYEKLGYAYEKSGDAPTALANYRLFIEKGGNNSTIAYKVGNDAFAKKEWELAAKSLLSVTGPKAEEFNLQYNLSRALYETKQFEQSITYMEKVLKRGPKVETQKQLTKKIGEAYENMKKPGQALQTYDNYVVKKWADKDVEFKRALLREQNAPGLAKKIYEQNITRYPNDMRNYLQLGKMLSDSKDPAELQKSASYLEKVLANAKGDDAALMLTVAEAYGKAGVKEKELKAYQRYSEVKPEDTKAYVRIGDLYMEMGEYTDAVVSYETALTLAPKDAALLLKTGFAYVYQEDWTNAITVLENARKIDAENTEVLKLLVDSYMNSGRKEDARTILKALLEDGDPKYQSMYARFLMQDGDYKGAIEIVDGMLEIFAENPQALTLKGEILRKKGDLDESAANIKYATDLDMYDAEANYQLAETYALMSGAKKRFALKSYDKAVQLNPEHGKAWYGKALMAKLYKMDVEYKAAIKKALKLLPGDPKVQKEAKEAGVL